MSRTQNLDRSDMPHRAPHRRAFTSTSDPLIVTPTFVARVDTTPRAERPQDTGSSVDRRGHEVQHPDANTDTLALEANPNLSFEHWDEYWRKVHGPKFAYDEPGSSSELVLRYDQIHRIPGGPSSAWAPPYEAMVDQSGRLFDDPAARVPSYRRSRWDGLAYIVYRTKDDVAATLGQEKFDKRIIADEHTAFRKVTRGLTQEHIVIPSRLRREPISLVRILQRRPELSQEEFQQRWLSEHSPLVLAQASTHIYVRRYAQLHTIGTVMDDPIAEAMDVIEIMGFSSVNDVEDYLTADGHHAISEHRETLAQPNAEFWTGINYTVIDRLMPELATSAR